METVAVSPDGRNAIRLFEHPLSFEVTRDGVTVVARSEIGLHLAGETLSTSGRIARLTRGAYEGTAASPVYKKASVDLSGRWLYADYGDWGVRLVARDDGVAYRFETRKDGKVTVLGETSSLVLPDPEARCWATFTKSAGCEESVPQAAAVKDVRTDGGDRKMIYLPFVYAVGGKTVAVAESDVFDYPVWNLTRADGAFEASFARWPAKTDRVGGWGEVKGLATGGRWLRVEKEADHIVETDGTRTYPWRTFVLADRPAGLCESDIIWALARPAAPEHDFSWVKPGKVAWEWWNDFDNQGAQKGCTTETYRRFIDFAAASGIEYVILDEGWSKALDIWTYNPNVDVPQIVSYAKEKGVGIILWIAWAQAAGDEARVVGHFAKLGVKGFKVDFIDRGDAESERFLWTFAEECRKSRMLIDYHGAHRPTGMVRAYPNVVNFEGVFGLEQTKFYRGDDFPANDVRAFFLRLTAGPMDYTPGAMDNYPVGRYTGTNFNPGSVGTRSRQIALMSLYEAPLQMLCDSPTKYEKNDECFRFMAATPVVWDDTVGLGGCPDTYAAVARRKGGVWYASAITNADARDVDLDTSFLGEGEWTAEIFRDAVDSDVIPTNYVHEFRKVKAGEKVKLHLAPGGGFAARFSK
jgi:alpha-glucosidase